MKVDKKILLDYFAHNEVTPGEANCITNLNKSYNCIKMLAQENFEKNENKLLQLENKIYTINGKTMTEKEKIIFETNRIYKVLEKKELNISLEDRENILFDLETINNLLEKYNNILDDLTIKYLKKKISILQATVGIENNFFKATHEAFLEKYRNIYISYIKRLKRTRNFR